MAAIPGNLAMTSAQQKVPTRRMMALVEAFPEVPFEFENSYGHLSGVVAKLSDYNLPVYGSLMVADRDDRSDEAPSSTAFLPDVTLTLRIRITNPAEAQSAAAYLQQVMDREIDALKAMQMAMEAERENDAVNPS